MNNRYTCSQCKVCAMKTSKERKNGSKMIYFVPNLDRKATNLAFFGDLQLTECWSNGAHVEHSCEFHTFSILFYVPNRMLHFAIDFNSTGKSYKSHH